MRRVETVRDYVNRELDVLSDDVIRDTALGHLNGVSLAAVILAKKRGLDAELAAIAGLLHDMYAYESGSYVDHAHKGAELARKILNRLQITDAAETDLICSAIYHHDDKRSIDGPMDELLKDADVIHHTLNDPAKAVKEKELVRYESLCDEFGLNSGQSGKDAAS